MSDNDVKLGYIGLGDMGAPMAKRLVDWPGGLTVYDLRRDAMTPLAEWVPASPTASKTSPRPTSSASPSSTTSRCATSSRANGLARFVKPGTVIAIHSTISETTAEELARQLAPEGIHIVDAPISGGKGAAEKGELAVMVGAERYLVRESEARLQEVCQRWSCTRANPARGPG